jgi:hypothetical protein
MLIRLFIVMLVLLLCVIAVHADKPIVIKDSEAIEYLGKEAERHKGGRLQWQSNGRRNRRRCL